LFFDDVESRDAVVEGVTGSLDNESREATDTVEALLLVAAVPGDETAVETPAAVVDSGG
jgi:hypothetical protein